MNDEQLRAAYRDAVASRAGSDRAACPAADAIAALVERRGPESDRLVTLDHVMSCRECLAEFELLRSLAPPQQTAIRRWLVPLTLAATIAIGLGTALIWRATTNQAPEIERGGSLSLLPIAPRGNVTQPGRLSLVWKPAGGAAHYELEIVRGDGTPVYAVVTADTSVTLPDSVALVPNGEYRWRVTARAEDGNALRSSFTRFRVRQP